MKPQPPINLINTYLIDHGEEKKKLPKLRREIKMTTDLQLTQPIIDNLSNIYSKIDFVV